MGNALEPPTTPVAAPPAPTAQGSTTDSPPVEGIAQEIESGGRGGSSRGRGAGGRGRGRGRGQAVTYLVTAVDQEVEVGGDLATFEVGKQVQLDSAALKQFWERRLEGRKGMSVSTFNSFKNTWCKQTGATKTVGGVIWHFSRDANVQVVQQLILACLPPSPAHGSRLSNPSALRLMPGWQR